METTFQDFLNVIFDFIHEPIQSLLEHVGIANIQITPSFFSDVTWFTITLSQLASLIVITCVSIFFLKFVTKLFKKILFMGRW